MAQIDVLGAVIDTLATHLETNVEGIEEVHRCWPDPSIKIAYPSISLTVAKPQAVLRYPELVDQEDNEDDEINVTAYYRIGSLYAAIQVDLWSQSATERGEYQNKIINALSLQVESYPGLYPAYRNSPNLFLQMTNYYDAYASYTLKGMGWPDTEDAGARREFRALVDVDCWTNIVITRTMPKMTKLDVDWRVGTQTLEDLADLSPDVQVIFEPEGT